MPDAIEAVVQIMEVEVVESPQETIKEELVPAPVVLNPAAPTPVVAAVEHAKKTKEQLMHEPLPLFDCIYCVKNSASVFQMVSDNFLA